MIFEVVNLKVLVIPKEGEVKKGVFRICPCRDLNPDWLRERQGSTLVLYGVDFESPPRPGILKF